jgi:hypothetical protein
MASKAIAAGQGNALGKAGADAPKSFVTGNRLDAAGTNFIKAAKGFIDPKLMERTIFGWIQAFNQTVGRLVNVQCHTLRITAGTGTSIES